MNNIRSPFQMIHNKVVSFRIEQDEQFQKFESTNVSLGADFIISNVQEKDKKRVARLNLLIELAGTTDNEEKVFEIKLDMVGDFECDSQEIDEEKFINMLKINGVSTLMQLSRAYITSTTALSGFIQPINFPMINVFELIKMKEKMEGTEGNET